MREDRIQSFNSAHRLPIVFVLDVSPSMGWRIDNNSSSIELLNEAMANFIAELQEDPKTRSATEVAFVTFSTDIELDTDFKPVNNLNVPRFKPVAHGGTQMADAVLRAIEKIEYHRGQLEDMEIGYYAPFLVIITDGNPDDNDTAEQKTKALKAIRSHCDSHIGAQEIIIPFVIGVGDHINPGTLNEYSAGFTDGYFPIRGDASKAKVDFARVFKLIGNSTKNSVHLNKKAEEIVSTVRTDMNTLLNILGNS